MIRSKGCCIVQFKKIMISVSLVLCSTACETPPVTTRADHPHPPCPAQHPKANSDYTVTKRIHTARRLQSYARQIKPLNLLHPCNGHLQQDVYIVATLPALGPPRQCAVCTIFNLHAGSRHSHHRLQWPKNWGCCPSTDHKKPPTKAGVF